MNKRLKILMYAHLFGEDASGMTLSNLELARGLFDQGHILEVVACKGETFKAVEDSVGFKITFLPKWNFSTMSSIYGKGLLNWFFMPLYISIINNRIHHFQPDIAFIADETANCFWGVWSHKNQKPYVSYCSVPYLYKWRKRSFAQSRIFLTYLLNRVLFKFMFNSYKNSGRILAASNSTKHELIRSSNQLGKKIYVLPRSIDNHFFESKINFLTVNELKAQFKISPNNFVIFSASRITKNKGIDDVLKAIAMLEPSIRNRVKYVIAGDGPANFSFKKLSVELGIAESVFFVGSKPHRSLISYYDLCDLYVLPSKRGTSESFGRVFVEAASRSKPSIGVNEGGMKDIIVENETGYLISAGDIQALQNRLSFCANNPKKIRNMGKKARFRANKLFTTKAVSGELSRHLFEVLNH